MNVSKTTNTNYRVDNCSVGAVRQIPTKRALDSDRLQVQNRVFAGTAGVSANNRESGFVPGFLNIHTGVAVASRFANGEPAPVHTLEGLPAEWITERNADGLATKACQGVVAGFLRFGRFYSRGEAASVGCLMSACHGDNKTSASTVVPWEGNGNSSRPTL